MGCPKRCLRRSPPSRIGPTMKRSPMASSASTVWPRGAVQWRYYGRRRSVQYRLRLARAFANPKSSMPEKVFAMKAAALKDDNHPIRYDKHGNLIYATRKVLGLFIVDPDIATRKMLGDNIVINFQSVVSYVTNHWFRSTHASTLSKDAERIIVMFACDDMDEIKRQVDARREQRYNAMSG